MSKHLFTSESVTKGHPDKICDQISDAILDAMLEQDPQSRVACETTCTTGQVLVMGEITTKASVDIPSIVRKTVCDIGYDDDKKGFNGNTCAVLLALDHQSPDIAMGVDKSLELKNDEEDEYNLNGAGDQGMMFGYACNETQELMPLPISLAHKLAVKLTEVRENGTLPYLYADGKTQITVEYEDDKPVKVTAVVVSSQHSADVELSQLRNDIIENVIKTTIPAEFIDEDTKYFVNPTGRFVIGGPHGDSGLTGRKIIAADMLVTVAVHSAVKTLQRLTEAPLTLLVGLLKISLPQVLQISAKLNLLSVLQSLFLLWLILSVQASLTTKRLQILLIRCSTFVRLQLLTGLTLESQFIRMLLLTVIWAGKTLVFLGKRPIWLMKSKSICNYSKQKARLIPSFYFL